MGKKLGVIAGKIALSFLAVIVALILGDVVGHNVLGLSPDPKSLTMLFGPALIFPIWYRSSIPKRLAATLIGPVAGFAFWCISLILPGELGAGKTLAAGVFRGGAFIFALVVEFLVMGKPGKFGRHGAVQNEEVGGMNDKRDDGQVESETERVPAPDPVRTEAPAVAEPEQTGTAKPAYEPASDLINNKTVTLAFAAIVVAMLIFPPWQYTIDSRRVGTSSKPAGYAFILTPPPPDRVSVVAGVALDWQRLALQLGAMAVIGGAAFYLRRRGS